MLLFVENSELPPERRNEYVKKYASIVPILEWEEVDRKYMTLIVPDCPPSLGAQFDLADRLAPLMTTASKLQAIPALLSASSHALLTDGRCQITRSDG